MHKLSQDKAPIYEALEEYKDRRVVSFDVPGHKQGKGNKELTEFLGKRCLDVDVNSMKPLDYLCHPVSVIKEAEELMADAFGASYAFLMVNGTSSSVQAMVMSVCKRGEKIIMPRNVHRSSINALIICGAVPVYVDPGANKRLGIPLGMDIEDIKKAISENPDAKAIIVNNPTYYGVCANLKEIVNIAHNAGMKVIVDEAHGTHLYFGEGLPINAMKAGADMAAVSVHKTGGSLTQSSVLLLGNGMNPGYVRQIINLSQTTSASYLLLSSLDLSRKNLALNGKDIFEKVKKLANYARQEINKIGGFYAFGTELIDKKAFYDFDITKLSVHTRDIGLAGIEVYDILRDQYDIQIEFGDIGNILAYISVGDNILELERLISALFEIKRLYSKNPAGMLEQEYITPIVHCTPQDAFYSNKKSVPLKDALGKVCAEFVMCYPPGIPILAPGELVTKDAVDYIIYAKEKGCNLTGAQDMKTDYLNVMC